MPAEYIELKWECATCRTELLARHLACTGCGKPREEEPYYDEPGNPTLSAAQVMADPALRAQAEGEPWLCTFCKRSQPRNAMKCGQCGADQGSSAVTGGAGPILPPADMPLPSSFITADDEPAPAAPTEELALPPPRPPPRREISMTVWLIVGAVVFVVVFGAAIFS